MSVDYKCDLCGEEVGFTICPCKCNHEKSTDSYCDECGLDTKNFKEPEEIE